MCTMSMLLPILPILVFIELVALLTTVLVLTNTKIAVSEEDCRCSTMGLSIGMLSVPMVCCMTIVSLEYSFHDNDGCDPVTLYTSKLIR